MPNVPTVLDRPESPGSRAPQAHAARCAAAPAGALRLRAPGHALRLGELVARARPGVTAGAIASAIRGGGLRVEGRPARDPEARVAPGARVDGRLPALASPAIGTPDVAVTSWLALVPAPPWPAGRFAAVGEPDAASRNDSSGARAGRDAGAGSGREGGREAKQDVGRGSGAFLVWRALETRDGVALLAIDAWPEGAGALRRRLAVSGFPILGDVELGGIAVAGGLRLRALAADGSEALPPDWPDEPVFPGEREDGERAHLRVSEATLRAVARGHPWALTDTETGDAGRFRPGTLVRLEGPTSREAIAAPRDERRAGGRRVAVRGPGRGSDPAAAVVLARIEGPGALAARVWEPRALPNERPRSVEARVAGALARRRGLLAAGETDCLRLVHGEADGLPGLAIDRVGPLLRALVTGRACEPVLGRALDAVAAALRAELGSDPPVVRVLHLRERPAGRFACVALVRGTLSPAALDAEGRVTVSERGLRFLVDPGLAAPEEPAPAYGFFPDQRENRARLAVVAAGGRWLNLFAHTGAFSVVLLAAGAASVTSVDLSAAYLRTLDENLARNGLAGPRHRSHRGDGRRFFEQLEPGERFDGIVLDPPTAAAAGRRFWSVRRDLPALLEAALRRLAPGGRLLVTRNDRSGRGKLGDLVREAAVRASCSVGSLAEAPPGADFPRLRGFPEGDPFEGVLLQRAPGDGGAPRRGRARA